MKVEKRYIYISLLLLPDAKRLINLHDCQDDRAKREREKAKWNSLSDEIAKLKIKVSELETTITIKDKESIYLKRALESFYSRFRSRQEQSA